MPIQVVCASCKTRFQVSEKFAGKQGPCPKCKTVLTVPKVEEEVKIHVPDEYAGGGASAAKDSKGRAVLKPLSRERTKVQPVVIFAAVAAALVTLIVAWVLGRGTAPVGHSYFVLGLGALLIAPPMAFGGYTILRDVEFDAYSGGPLILRTAIVALVYAGLWGMYAIIAARIFGGESRELWQILPYVAVMIIVGSLTSLATFDLESVNAFFHYAFFLAVTVLLRLVMNLPPF